MNYLFCNHRKIQFVRNIYGDEINQVDGSRSWWQCKRCGYWMLADTLHAKPDNGETVLSLMHAAYARDLEKKAVLAEKGELGRCCENGYFGIDHECRKKPNLELTQDVTPAPASSNSKPEEL